MDMTLSSVRPSAPPVSAITPNRRHRCVVCAHQTSATSAPSPWEAPRRALAIGVSVGIGMSHLLGAQPAEAFGRNFPLEITGYEVAACGDRAYVPKPTGYTCLDVKGTATITGKDIEAADVFGFVTDAKDNSALAVNPDGTTRTVVAGINTPLKGGGTKQEVDFTLVITEQALDSLPLKFKGFKLNPSLSVVEDRFLPLSGCELEPSLDDCLL